MPREMMLATTIGQTQQWEVRTVPKAGTIHPDSQKGKEKKIFVSLGKSRVNLGSQNAGTENPFVSDKQILGNESLLGVQE